MARKTAAVKPRLAKPIVTSTVNLPASTFITLKVSAQRLNEYLNSTIQFQPETDIPAQAEEDNDSMRTRGAWDKNLANSQSSLNLGGGPPLRPANHPDYDFDPSLSDSLPRQPTNKPSLKPRLQIPVQHRARRAKSRLVDVDDRRDASPASTTCEESTPAAFEAASHPHSNEENESPESSDIETGARASQEVHKPRIQADVEMADPPHKPQRPTLKLSFSKPSIPQANNTQGATQTPNPQSAVRTPSIKLKLGGTPLGPSTPASANGVKRKKKPSDAATPASATKKRKIQKGADPLDLEGGTPSQPSARPKITFKNTSTSVPNSAQTPAPVLKLKSKGKIPKRPPGMGYDSELEDREQDPVILEGFILRMEPGADCDFLRKQIEEGRVGVPRIKGGPEITLRMLDTLGRRGIMVIRGNRYATTLVDLPCIIEGMKSWDKKGWMKSTDICQMLLVLGRCASDDEARNYPLPPDVDPKTYQYAHGLTAPMKWVRKRRFARTKRAKVDDIEAVERRVAALLEADKAAAATRFQLHDSDPRLIEQPPSEDFSDEGDDEDAEAEDDDGGYFPIVDELDDDAVNEFQNYWESEGEGDENEAPATGTVIHSHTSLQPPDAFDSSIAVTSNSASPLVTAAQTPASGAGHSSGDEDAEGDEDDDDDDDDEEERDDDQKEEDEQMRRAKEVIADFKTKIKQQLEKMNAPGTVLIMKRKLATSIQNLRADIVQRKKTAGIPLDEEDEE
ncbi:uncharacterized protein A1O9_01357 [Exophiala aquamarina CBS 119918]|uniref:TAFII55 protein conserved region domain-containing protein n=1 Tax=Exophiala aquamarina CBS 119918 TaxID=1182545 RepID=A0A072Q636_9EURO|nr:uncharacterized protein A1O9_01357 [Exophiala aquamarina CBS 119918]KEF63380.1 hypothetical protein A1O9_01357 [Exophiala aquamarina CBS 119918]